MSHPSYQPHLDVGAHWGPASSETHDHRHWFAVHLPFGFFDGTSYAWTDTELNRPVAVIRELDRIGR